jgi:RNA polymerase sigma-70 factor (ECF subfamily)
MPCLSSRPRDADEFLTTLRLAQTGSSAAIGGLLEACRQYLLLIANHELEPNLVAKLGASDLVQETFLTAQQNWNAFRGATRPELMAWLRQILLNHLLTVRRRYFGTDKRSVYREISLDDFSRCSARALQGDTSSPSARLARSEELEALSMALLRLPEHYRLALLLRHREQLSFDEVAGRLGVTSAAARQVWFRAVSRLRRELGPSSKPFHVESSITA